MGERKVVNKYIPPDFNPLMVSRVKKRKNEQIPVRSMLSMNMRCSTCGNYLYKGTKFNMRKELIIGETYLGIQILRFYFKCSSCSAEIALKTDPQNSDYSIEFGATRNFEPWREEDELVQREKQKKEAKEMGDAMKSLENKTFDSKTEMCILAALEEMKSLKSRHEAVTVDAMLKALQRTNECKKLEEEDEKLIESIFFHKSEDYVRRMHDEDLDDDEDCLKRQKGEYSSNLTDSLAKFGVCSLTHRGKKNVSVAKNDAKFSFKPSTVRISVRRAHIEKQPEKKEGNTENGKDSRHLAKLETRNQELGEAINGTSNVLQCLCQNYDSDDE